MQPQVTLRYAAGSSATINIKDWQLGFSDLFGNVPTVLVSSQEVSGWRDMFDVTITRYYTADEKLDFISIIIGTDPLYTDIRITIK